MRSGREKGEQKRMSPERKVKHFYQEEGWPNMKGNLPTMREVGRDPEEKVEKG